MFERNPFAFTVNGSLWTIRYELAMYVLLALVSWLGGRRFRALYALWAMALAAIWLLAMRLDWPDVPAGAPVWFKDLWSMRQLTSLGVYFFIGSAFARADVKSHWWMAVLGASALLAARSSADAMVIQLGLWVGVSCMVFFLGFWGRNATRGQPHEDLSYGVYIYAFPIQQAVTEISLSRGWSLSVCMALSLALTLVLAAASWFWVEKPALAFTRNWLRKKRRRSAMSGAISP
ncbi:acyltransferase family protein [Diaphorobacter aerolatus]|uniref:Acyltransferase 3 domain-containing protein n=1 Tax=Diaphorobacter aerolatus TaxID=1288495 RepID=A0A7H0GIK6_9BURK|nr:acyltransferase family protein [Diaphorobacter aerolatus]QNP48122.1 hypothetical protein H9K75_19015 [Diaphorobacter aerolatus]